MKCSKNGTNVKIYFLIETYFLDNKLCKQSIASGQKMSRVSNLVKYLLVKCFLNILAVVYFDFYAFISSFPLFVFTVLETFWFGVISTNPLLLTFVFITFLTFSYVIRIGDLKMKNGTLLMLIHLSYQRNQIVLKFCYLAYTTTVYKTGALAALKYQQYK